MSAVNNRVAMRGPWDGDIDEIQVVPRALGEEEIQEQLKCGQYTLTGTIGQPDVGMMMG